MVRWGRWWCLGFLVQASCASTTLTAPVMGRATLDPAGSLKTEPRVTELSDSVGPATGSPTTPEEPAVTTSDTSETVEQPVAAPERHYAGLREEDILKALEEASVFGASSVGNTSLNFHVDLEGPIDGGYKPSETRHLEHYRAEVAAFRFNRLMGLERVPPAVLRKVELDNVKRLPADVLSRAHVYRGQLRGAMIYWVPVLRNIALNGRTWVNRWSRWLHVDGAIPDDQRWRAEDISTLVSFDFLTANWDRWNGDNSLVDLNGRVVYRDNNGSFLIPLGSRRTEVLVSWLHKVQRFSRRFIDRARTLTAEEIDAEINRGIDPRRPLLSPEQIAQILGRRDQLVHYVDDLVAQSGEAAVYAFE